MNELSRYVSRNVLGAMLLILFLLVGLDVVFSFIGELQQGLRGNYKAPQAFWYALYCEPGDAYQLLPIAALVGGIVGLGMLASNSELTIMRAAGVSIRRIVWWVLKPALLLVLMGILLAQFLVPWAQERAEMLKAVAVGNGYIPGQLWGYWHREGNSFVQINLVRPDGVLQGVNRFTLGPDGHLEQMQAAARADFVKDRGWQLQGIQTLSLAPEGTAHTGGIDRQVWQTELTPGFLRLATVDPEFLSLSNLYLFAHNLTEQKLDASNYFLEFWKKLLAPLATISMVLIACSFIFGPLRSVTMGLRIVSGVMTGLLFRYGQDFFGYASLVYHFSPVLAAGLPIMVCLVAGTVAIARVR
jgi:lipopolysaccharide export system permease protein